MKSTKNILLLMTLLFGIVLSLNFASAAIVWATPSANSNHSSDISLNVTYVDVTDITTPTTANSTLYENSTGSWVEVTVSSESIVDAINWIATLDITTITNSAFVTLNISLGNATDLAASTLLLGLTIDDTAPTCTTGQALLQSKNLEIPRTNVLTCSCTDDIDGAPTITRTLTQPGASTVTITTTPFTTTRSDLAKIGLYTFSCQGTDYSGATVTNTNTFTVNSDDDGGSTRTTQITSRLISGNGAIIAIVMFIIIIASLGVFWAMKAL